MEDTHSADDQMMDFKESGDTQREVSSSLQTSANQNESRNVNQTWTIPHGSFSKRVITKGVGFTTPNDGASCQVTLRCISCESSEADVGYPLGEQQCVVLGDGCGRLSEVIDACLETMHRGETCELQILDRVVETIGQTCDRNTEEENASNTAAAFHITLHSFERNKDIHKMSVADILTRVSQLKDYGTKCFKDGNYEVAERFYIRGKRYLIMVCHPDDVKDLDDNERTEYESLKKGCSLNIAACQLKHKRYHHVITHCTSALQLEPLNMKALYRRCQAYISLDEFEKARLDIKTALKEDPKSKVFLEQNRLLIEREKKVYKKLSSAMNKIFGGSSSS